MSAPEGIQRYEDLRARIDEAVKATQEMGNVVTTVAAVDPAAAPVRAGLLGLERVVNLGASLLVEINGRDWEFGAYTRHDEEIWVGACARARAMWTAVATMAGPDGTSLPDVAAIVEQTVTDQTRLLRSDAVTVDYPGGSADGVARGGDGAWLGSGGAAYGETLLPQLEAWRALQRACALIMLHLRELRGRWPYLQAAATTFVVVLAGSTAFAAREIYCWFTEYLRGVRMIAVGEAQAASGNPGGWNLIAEGGDIKHVAGKRCWLRLAGALSATVAAYLACRPVREAFRASEAKLYAELPSGLPGTILERGLWPDPVAAGPR